MEVTESVSCIYDKAADEVDVAPHGEEAPLRRLEPCGPSGGHILRDAAKTPLLRMRFWSIEWRDLNG